MFTIDLFLQIWCGVGYLVAKILLASAEGMNNSRKLRIIGWFSYLIGIPAWVILLAGKNNWVVSAIDLGSVPSMILGIIIAWKQNIQINKIFDMFVKFFTFLMIMLGTFYSIYYFHGIKTFSQILEILITLGFFIRRLFTCKKKSCRMAFICPNVYMYGNINVNTRQNVIGLSTRNFTYCCNSWIHKGNKKSKQKMTKRKYIDKIMFLV